jgi:hypothetical protein
MVFLFDFWTTYNFAKGKIIAPEEQPVCRINHSKKYEPQKGDMFNVIID